MIIKIMTLLSSMLIIPTLVFANDTSYNTLSKVLNTILSVLAYFGYAIAIRNINNGWDKICIKWSK